MYLYPDGRMDGRTDGRTDERTEGRTNGRKDGRTDGRTNGHGQINMPPDSLSRGHKKDNGAITLHSLPLLSSPIGTFQMG